MSGDETALSSPDLRVRVNALEHADAAIISRINVLEQWQRQTEIAEARKDEQWKNVDKRFDDLDKKIDKIGGLISKLLWTIATTFFVGLATAFIAFLINGGMKVP